MTRPSRVWLLSMIGLAAAAVPSLFAALTLTTSTNSVAIPFATTDYNSSTGAAQLIKTSAQTLTILSTTATWTLSVRALTATFLALTTSNQVLSTGPKSASNQTRALDYRLNSNLNSNPPGTYTISVIYTLTSP